LKPGGSGIENLLFTASALPPLPLVEQPEKAKTAIVQATYNFEELFMDLWFILSIK
jgi:hypothetical protein